MFKPGGWLLLLCTAVAFGVGGPSVLAQSSVVSRSCSDDCDGHWSGPSGVDVQGSPEFREGGSTGTYIWHDGHGWHLRVFNPTHSQAGFRGSIAADRGRFTVFHGTSTGGGDSVTANSAGTVLTYSLSTTDGSKGVDFRVSGSSMTFTVLNSDGSPGDRAHIFLGDDRNNPPTNSFNVIRDDEDASDNERASDSATMSAPASGGVAGVSRGGSGRASHGVHRGLRHGSHSGIATHPRR